MKAYITCPVSHSKERLKLLPIIEKIVKEKNIEPFVFQIGGTPEEIFKRDYEQLKNCDLLIAEVSEPSHGVGIEIGISYCHGLKIILLLEKGKSLTKLAQGIPNIIIIEYENIKDLTEKLKIELNNIKLVNKKLENYHKSRQMFCIKDNRLIIAGPNLPYSHEEWFKKLGWITKNNDSIINEIVRGIIDEKGEIYFFISDHDITPQAESIFFPFLNELVIKLNINPNANIYGGTIKGELGDKWLPKKHYGKVEDLLNI